MRQRALKSFLVTANRCHLAELLCVSSSLIKQRLLVPISTIINNKMADYYSWLTMKSPRSAKGKYMNKKIRLIFTTREGCTHRACHLILAFSRNQISFSWFSRSSMSCRIKLSLKGDTKTAIIMAVARDAVISTMVVVSTINTATIADQDTPLLPRWDSMSNQLLCLIQCKMNNQQDNRSWSRSTETIFSTLTLQ